MLLNISILALIFGAALLIAGLLLFFSSKGDDDLMGLVASLGTIVLGVLIATLSLATILNGCAILWNM